VVNEQLLRIADMETEVPSSPARPGAVASNLVEVTVAAAVMNVNTPLDSARDKELVGTGAYADTNPGMLDATDTRALGLPEAPADQVADVPMPHAGLINFVSAVGEGPIVAALTAPVSGAELFGSARAERMVGTDAVLTQRYSGVPDDADTIIRALSLAADEDGLLLRTGVEGAGAAALTILEGMKDVGTSMVAAQAAEDVLHNLAQVPLAVLVKAAFATEEGTQCQYFLCVRCLGLTETSYSIQSGQRCGWAQALTSPLTLWCSTRPAPARSGWSPLPATTRCWILQLEARQGT